MSLHQKLSERSGNQCELCSSKDNLAVYSVPPKTTEDPDHAAFLCTKCFQMIEGELASDANHWRCLSESMWSEVPSVKVLSWRILKALTSESWAQDLYSQLYLDEELQAWAQEGESQESLPERKPTKDSNGNILVDGDSVTLIKDLEVKGAGFTAKRGTLVKNISLTDNPLHIEGRVNGVQIVLVAAYLKKVQG